MSEFNPPDWSKPIDLERHLASIPVESKVKGLFFHSALEQAKAATGKVPGRETYHTLLDYPSSELARVLAECAGLMFPDLPLRKGLRYLGQKVFPMMRESTGGKLLFGVAGRDLVSAMKLVGRAYSLFSSNVTARLTSSQESLAVIEIRNAWTFPDCYHVGIFEGAVTSYGRHGMVTIREHSPCDVDLQVYFV